MMKFLNTVGQLLQRYWLTESYENFYFRIRPVIDSRAVVLLSGSCPKSRRDRTVQRGVDLEVTTHAEASFERLRLPFPSVLLFRSS